MAYGTMEGRASAWALAIFWLDAEVDRRRLAHSGRLGRDLLLNVDNSDGMVHYDGALWYSMVHYGTLWYSIVHYGSTSVTAALLSV